MPSLPHVGGDGDAAAQLLHAAELANIGAVVKQMRLYASNARVQQLGCDALQRLSVNEHKARQKAGSCGTMEAVVSALEAHPHDMGVQAAACAALSALAADDGNRMRAVRAGGIEAVVAAMRGHPETEAVQEAAHAALHCLVAESAMTWGDLAQHAGDAKGMAMEALTHSCLLVVGVALVGVGAASWGWAHASRAVGGACKPQRQPKRQSL